MAAANARELAALSLDTDYQAGTLEIVTRLLDLLQVIAHDPHLGGSVALKGGTALNGFHSNWPRLSVDIDLTYVGEPEWGAALAAQLHGDNALRQILVGRGYKIKNEPAKEGGGKWIVGFDPLFAGGAQLEIDLGYVERQPLFTPVRMSSAPLGGSVVSGMLVLDRREIIAGKMGALFARGRSRDLFDAVAILSGGGVGGRDIRAAFLAICAADSHDPRGFTIDRIGAGPEDLKKELGICLPDGFFNGTPVEAWIEWAVETCRHGLAELVDWNEKERDFLEGIWERGEINVHLLDATDDLRARIAAMPQLHWRCQRVLEKKERDAQAFSVRRRLGPSMGF